MMKLFHLISLMFLISSTFISISASSWLGAWVGLEINLLSIIPILILSKNMRSSEATIKYFITQIVASIMILAFILLTMMQLPNSYFGTPLSYQGISLALMLKMGAAPLHFWFPSVMEGLSWVSCSIIMTWQKITPIILLSFIVEMNTLTIMFISLSALIGAMGGLNQTSLKKIMAFSSINHISWMLVAISINENYWFTYFLIYSTMALSASFLFFNYSLFNINQMWNFMNKTTISKITILCIFMSMGGLPPFLGFFPKWIIIMKMINIHTILVILLIMTSLLTLYFYTRLLFSALSMKSLSSTPNKNFKSNSLLDIFISFISVSFLMLIPLISI
uniref:NADH-ubiquinone oxidoreductase chain 2 n=1 Tax=Campodea fragilis TaxID=383857 RepID=Q0ZD18_9HEXA|nr:NADH dehydrogenase subunit 2 [Campodea fragilis]ABF49562.1 NADH dehydrogenase subunit 2 [Campodea fragilis]